MAGKTKGPVGPELLGRLLDEHGPALVLYARQWCGAPEDVVQDALIALASQKHAPDRIVPWLYRTVRNGALSARRSERRRRKHEAAGSPTTEWLVAAPESRLDAEVAAAALAGLPVEQREAIVARFWGGLTFEQIAELAGCTASTAHRRYAAGLSALRERLGIPCPKRSTENH